MQNIVAANELRLNHVGFRCGASKRFLTESPDSAEFTVEYLEHTNYETVMRGTLTEESGELGSAWIGDFSALTKPGDYRIRCGRFVSRHFVVSDLAYDMAERLMLSFFTYQRCGSRLGWAGLCHQEDGVLYETGEHIDLRGGYHQSCDLRKSPGGVPIGVLGLMRYAKEARPAWDVGQIDDELRWACDYYLKTVQANGCVLNTLNAPLGWGGRVFYASGAPASAQWNTLQILARGAAFFRNDALYAARLLDEAGRIYAYLTRADRPYGPYVHPDKLPRGMDPEYFFAASYRGSTSDLCGKLASEIALYEATGEGKWARAAELTADEAAACVYPGVPDENIAAGSLILEPNSARLMECTGGYAWSGAGIQALLDACERFPEAKSAEAWREAVGRAAEQARAFAMRNVWRLTPRLLSQENWDMPTGHPAPGRPAQTLGGNTKDPIEAGYVLAKDGARVPCYFGYASGTRPTLMMYSALLLLRAARLLGRSEYLPLAQAQIDYLMGCNPYDASHIECVGYNQYAPPVFGQFFPSTPKLPGAIHIGLGIADIAHSNGAEYDMPCVGYALWALGEARRGGDA